MTSCDHEALLFQLAELREELEGARQEATTWRGRAHKRAAAIGRARAVLHDPPVPSRMLIPVVLAALDES